MSRESLVDDLSFSFCVPPLLHPHPQPQPSCPLQITRLQNSDDIRVAGQSHGVILKAQHRQTTSLKSKRQSPLRSLKFPTVITSRASRFPCENFTYSFFFYKKQKRRKKKSGKTKRLLSVGLLIAAETCFWEDYFLFVGMIIDACACK